MGTEAKAAAKSSPPEAAERDTASSTTLPAAASSTRAAAATAATWARRMLPGDSFPGARPWVPAGAIVTRPFFRLLPPPPPRPRPRPGPPSESPPGEVQGVDELVGADGADEDERAAAPRVVLGGGHEVGGPRAVHREGGRGVRGARARAR